MSALAQASDGCTFDQEHQAQVIVAVSKSAPGAVVDVEKRQVTWVTPKKETTVFSYGGCADLGSMVSRSTPRTAPRSQAQVFALAKELAERFWSSKTVAAGSATDALVTGLSTAAFTVDVNDGRTAFNVRDPGYVQLYVEHEFKDGIDKVTIAWQGNF
jgi:hypothetical protein